MTNLLISKGLKSNQFEFYYENNNIKAIQGNQADYIILYNLKADNVLNIDTDLQSINTYATRSKDYTLIYEPINPNSGTSDGLFTANGIVSEYFKQIYSYSLNLEQINDKKD